MDTHLLKAKAVKAEPDIDDSLSLESNACHSELAKRKAGWHSCASNRHGAQRKGVQLAEKRLHATNRNNTTNPVRNSVVDSEA